jgi:two-component system cell cycle sensor histidine kinase PleC
MITAPHSAFFLAVPFAGVGFLTPILPANVTATLLLSFSAAMVLFAVGSGRKPVQPSPAAGAGPANGRRSAAGQLAPERSQRRTSAGPAPRRLRFAAEPQDRSWAELMARVNHDLRTPLNAVMGFSEIMTLELFGPLGDHRYQDYVHHIRDSSTELLKAAEDTLALTALMATPPSREDSEACDVAGLAKDAWTFLARKAAGRAVDFDVSIPAGLEVIGDARALRQVLVNLISEGIGRAANGARVVLLAETESDLVELSVSVSGEGKRQVREGGSLAICLARTLLELQGASLLEFDGPTHGWRAVTVLDRASQADFFGKSRRMPEDATAAFG